MTNAEQCEITINFDADKLDVIRAAAAMSERPVDDFIIDAAFDKAVKILLKDKVAFLSAEAYQAVCQTILQLDESNQRVRLD